MRKGLFSTTTVLIVGLFTTLCFAEKETENASPRRVISLNGEWKFLPPSESQGKEYFSLDTSDSQWVKMNVPYFWNGPYLWDWYPGGNPNPYPNLHGIAWYRRDFQLEETEGKKALLKFYGVSQKARVWVNEKFAGEHFSCGWLPFEFDISDFLKSGRNLIAVEVNDEGYEGGIWQDVEVIVRDRQGIDRITITPGLDNVALRAEVSNESTLPLKTSLEYTITGPVPLGTVLKKERREFNVIEPGAKDSFSTTLKDLKPELWSPQNPALYNFTVRLIDGNKVIDEVSTLSGFRTFQVKGGRFYLNGKPYFLRGFNPLPTLEIPNDVQFIDKYFDYFKSFNSEATRFHLRGIGSLKWLDACDRKGILVIAEGPINNYDWLRKTFPDAETEYREMMSQWIKEFYNHPSIVIWSITNEVNIDPPNIENRDLLTRTVDYLKKNVDSSRPYVDSAGFGHGNAGGDIDTLNEYEGWYTAWEGKWLWYKEYSQFGYKMEKWRSNIDGGDRPVIFTESVGAYTQPYSGMFFYDGGKSTESALVWIGHSPDPGEDALNYQADLARNAAGIIRSLRGEDNRLSGFLAFSTFFFYEKEMRLEPKPICLSLKETLSPVLIYPEYWRRNYYAGDIFSAPVFIVNDSISLGDLNNLQLEYMLVNKKGDIILNGSEEIDNVPYYGKKVTTLTFKIPDGLPAGDYFIKMVLKKDSLQVSESNGNKVFIASKEWLKVKEIPQEIGLYDPEGATSRILDTLGIKYRDLSGFDKLEELSLVIIGASCLDEKVAGAKGVLEEYVKQGGKVLVLEQERGEKFTPFEIDLVSRTTYFINFELYAKPFLDGLSHGDFRRWNDLSPTFSYILGKDFQAYPQNQMVDYLWSVKDAGLFDKSAVFATRGEEPYFALFQVYWDKGSYIFSQLEAVKRFFHDPKAGRFICNLLSYAVSKENIKRPVYQRIVQFGDFKSENGVIFDPRQGFRLNEIVWGKSYGELGFGRKIVSDESFFYLYLPLLAKELTIEMGNPTGENREFYIGIKPEGLSSPIWLNENKPLMIEHQREKTFRIDISNLGISSDEVKIIFKDANGLVLRSLTFD